MYNNNINKYVIDKMYNNNINDKLARSNNINAISLSGH